MKKHILKLKKGVHLIFDNILLPFGITWINTHIYLIDLDFLINVFLIIEYHKLG